MTRTSTRTTAPEPGFAIGLGVLAAAPPKPAVAAMRARAAHLGPRSPRSSAALLGLFGVRRA